MLVCSDCSKDWNQYGQSWKRTNSNKIDFRCSSCGCKRKPVEHDFNRDILNHNELPEINYNDVDLKSILYPTSKKVNKLQKFGQPKSWVSPSDYGKISFRKHIIIPDCQVTPNSPKEHLNWIGKYIAEKRPDVIINLGDFADMESLSSYDKGKMSFEGRSYLKDIEAAKNAMDIMTKPFRNINGYNPEMHLVCGNHEYRIERVVEEDRRLEGTLSIDDLEYESFGWKVHPFLEIAVLDGVHYSHYFCNQLSGKPIGGESILTRLKNIGFSFVMGHQQIYLTGTRSLSNGKRIRGIVQGSCYLHDEVYRGPQSNGEWRGIFILHEVHDGDFSLMEVSLDYLCRRYEGVPVWRFMQKKYPEIFEKSTWMKFQRNNK